MRRVLKPGGMLFLLVAWNCPTWLADGFDVRPYEDFTLLGKLVKASIGFRSTILFDWGHRRADKTDPPRSVSNLRCQDTTALQESCAELRHILAAG